MASEIILPKLGMNTEVATIVAWRKQVGDAVRLGDVIADVETEKATIELEAEAAGIIRKLLVAEGDQVSVHQPIALVGTADEDITALEQHLAAQPIAAPSHVERIYQAWQGSSTTPNGHRPVAATRSLASGRPRATTGATAGSDRLDPAAIRARLTEKGLLSAPQPVTSKTRLAIYGSGLGAKQLLEVTRQRDDVEVVGLIDDNAGLHGTELGGVPVVGGFAALAALVKAGKLDGVVLSFHSEVRKKLHERVKRELDVRIYPLVDPRAIVGMGVTIADGALIEAGAVIGPGVTIEEGAIVDVGAVVAHDCLIGPFSHLAPGCRLSGVVCLKENVLVGVGAALNSTITIGRNVIITPGAAVMNDLPDDVVVGGVPAKIMGTSRRGA
jgi:sugar O-acyltransferase (sialic acid O-acetyltransferase NeuD family)